MVYGVNCVVSVPLGRTLSFACTDWTNSTSLTRVGACAASMIVVVLPMLRHRNDRYVDSHKCQQQPEKCPLTLTVCTPATLSVLAKNLTSEVTDIDSLCCCIDRRAQSKEQGVCRNIDRGQEYQKI